MNKLLITGSSGFLGWNLCQIAKPNWDIFGTYLSNAPTFPGVILLKLDLTNFDEVQAIFADIQPNAVIHTAAQSQPNFCQNNPEESHEINVTAATHLAGLCADAEIPFVFTSTDLVFDGLNAPYRETDPVSPVSIYGEQKVMAELEIADRYPKAAICRMPLMFGEAGPGSKSFLQPMLETLRDGKELSLFTDEFRTPVSATTAAGGLLLALEKVEGLLHLGGKERISRYDFFQLAVEELQLENVKIKPCLQQDVEMAAPRPPDVSLDSSKAFELGYDPPTLREQLEQLRGKV